MTQTAPVSLILFFQNSVGFVVKHANEKPRNGPLMIIEKFPSPKTKKEISPIKRGDTAFKPLFLQHQSRTFLATWHSFKTKTRQQTKVNLLLPLIPQPFARLTMISFKGVPKLFIFEKKRVKINFNTSFKTFSLGENKPYSLWTHITQSTHILSILISQIHLTKIINKSRTKHSSIQNGNQLFNIIIIQV